MSNEELCLYIIRVRADAIVREANELLLTLALESKDLDRAKKCVEYIETHLERLKANWPK